VNVSRCPGVQISLYCSKQIEEIIAMVISKQIQVKKVYKYIYPRTVNGVYEALSLENNNENQEDKDQQANRDS